MSAQLLHLSWDVGSLELWRFNEVVFMWDGLLRCSTGVAKEPVRWSCL